MPDYSKGKIYMVASPNTNLIYIGSTTQSLSKRMGQHREKKRTESKVIIEAGDAYIELIEEFPCENIEQLNKREGEIIRSRECVNKAIAGRSKKEWYEENKEELLEKMKQYNTEHREEKIVYLKQYYQNNKEKFKKYSEDNKGKINALKKKRYDETPPVKCDICGSNYHKSNKSYHLKSMKHQRALELI